MLLPNNTHYHNQYTRTFNFVLDTNSFFYESNKRLGYFQRLYFEFEYTKKVNGQSFFYTFTYNDKSIPKFFGKDCYSYDDIRYITNGALSKRLRREYGSRLRYFCSCESGEGKGKRGLGHNPHYHFIFFVQPLHDKDNNPIFDTYRKVPALIFRDMCCKIWQGSTGFIPFQIAKYGICKPGNFLGVIQDSTPFNYVSKYVTKDNNDIQLENYARRHYEIECRSMKDFWAKAIFEYYLYLKEVNPFAEISFSDICSDLMLHSYNRWRKTTQFVNHSLGTFIHEHGNLKAIEAYKELHSWYISWYIPNYIEYNVGQFKCKCSGKVRCSKSLGEYGLNFVKNHDTNPTFTIPTKKGYKECRPCLYYIRHLYYDIKICPVTGNPLYYLNDTGIKYKLNSLKSTIDNFITDLKEKLSYVVFNNIQVLDTGVDSTLSFIRDINASPELLNILYYRYAVYHFVYEFRSYDSNFSTLIDLDLKFEHVLIDYERFLKNSCYYLDYENLSIHQLFYFPSPRFSACTGVSWSSHPLFSPYLKYFDFFDKVIEVVNNFLSDKLREDFVQSSAHLQRMNSLKFNALVC